MLLLADRVETAQGDTRRPRPDSTSGRVISYGNRLFCDSEGAELRHRWGSTKLYRGYFQDYQSFLERPDKIAEKISRSEEKTVILQSALRDQLEALERAAEQRETTASDLELFFLGRVVEKLEVSPRTPATEPA